MKNIVIAVCSLFAIGSVVAAELPQWASPLAYEQIGSCADHDLGFNAGRFTGIKLDGTRDGYDLYLQLIVYLKNDGTAYVRTQEVGLIECNETPEGKACAHWPYSYTKKFISTTWSEVDNSIVIADVGTITRVRDDFPWLGYNIKVSDSFPIEIARSAESIGGKIQVNFDEYGVNTGTICKTIN